MRQIFIAFIVSTILFSCSEQNHFPEKKSIKIPIKELGLIKTPNNMPLTKTEANIDFSKLQFFISQFESKDENFNIEQFEKQWIEFSLKTDFSTWNNTDIKTWIEITGLLIELTNETKYAEELERISYFKKDIQRLIAPYILTKKIDHIYVNLFQPVEFKYEHSMKGEVIFRQETDYPKSGSVKLFFGMTERRHIELFIRIPSWAEGTTVGVKGVKYFADSGSYCKIVKKWKEGDIVEIEFPMELMPQQ